MAKYRGSQGNAHFGGAVQGTPLVQGAVAQGATAATFDAASLTGTILPGDVFTVAGDAQEYTVVTGGAAASDELAITFTPAVVPGAGWADNAAVTLASNSVANVVEWEAEVSRPVLEASVMQSAAREIDLDIPGWRGSVVCFLDYGDERHAALIDAAVSNAAADPISVTLSVAPGKNLWGALHPMDLAVVARMGAFFEVSFNFEGEGALAPDWT